MTPHTSAATVPRALWVGVWLASLARCSADSAPPTVPDTGECDAAVCLRVGHCVAGEASAQFRRQTALPTAVAPSTRLPMRVTFDNCSGLEWTPERFSLIAVDPEEGNAWSLRRMALPDRVPDGAEVTLNFELQAPLATGAYPSRWAISRDRVEVFQEHTPTQVVQVLAPADCTEAGARVRFRSQTDPPEFIATGARLHTRVTFANCDTEALTRDTGWALASLGDPASTWGPARIELPGDVPSGAEVTFELELTAPTEPGRYRYAWQMAQRDTPVGEASPARAPTVLRPADCTRTNVPAAFVSQREPPDTLDPNQSVDVRVTWANCSNATWDAGYHIDSALTGGAHLWGAGPVALPLAVGVGYSIDVPFRVRAPGTPGRYRYRWAVTGPSGALDEPSPAMERTVRCIPSCGDHNCGGDGCGGSCGGCPGGWNCDGAHCQPPDQPQCGLVQWWNSYVTYEHISSGWHDTDLGLRGSTPVQLRHTSRLIRTGVYGWGYMPEFIDLATGVRFRMLHLRPQNQWATDVGREYPAGYVVGLSGGDTYDTGLPTYSTGAHLCIQTLVSYWDAFPRGTDACR